VERGRGQHADGDDENDKYHPDGGAQSGATEAPARRRVEDGDGEHGEDGQEHGEECRVDGGLDAVVECVVRVLEYRGREHRDGEDGSAVEKRVQTAVQRGGQPIGDARPRCAKTGQQISDVRGVGEMAIEGQEEEQDGSEAGFEGVRDNHAHAGKVGNALPVEGEAGFVRAILHRSVVHLHVQRLVIMGDVVCEPLKDLVVGRGRRQVCGQRLADIVERCHVFYLVGCYPSPGSGAVSAETEGRQGRCCP